MSDRTKIWIINCCLLFIGFMECGGPREIYDYATGGVKNPQYLFAGSHWEICRRIRRVVESDGKVNIFIENFSGHSMYIDYDNTRLRNLIMLCYEFHELGWKMND